MQLASPMPQSRTTTARRAARQSALPSPPPADPPAAQRGRRPQPERALPRARRPARQRFLPRADPARARLRRARADRAAPRRARALLPRDRAAVARRRAVGAPAGGLPPQDARADAVGDPRGRVGGQPRDRLRPPRGQGRPHRARARRRGAGATSSSCSTTRTRRRCGSSPRALAGRRSAVRTGRYPSAPSSASCTSVAATPRRVGPASTYGRQIIPTSPRVA